MSVTATRPVGPASYSVSWDGLRTVAAATGSLSVADATRLTLDEANPASGQVTDPVAVGATLTDSDGVPLAGKTVSFAIGGASGSGTTDAAGHAGVTLTLVGPAAASTVSATFAGAGDYGTSSDSAAFAVQKEDTTLAMADAVSSKNTRAVAIATLQEADGAALEGRTITFAIEDKVKGKTVVTNIGTAITAASGVARLELAAKYVSTARRTIRATFAGDGSFVASVATAAAYRG